MYQIPQQFNKKTIFCQIKTPVRYHSLNQEIIAIVIVCIAAAFSFRSFFKQFLSKDPACTSCNCDTSVNNTFKENRNTIHFKRINTR